MSKITLILTTILSILWLSISIPVFAETPIFFKDLPESHWAKPYIDPLSTSEIINGYPDGTFKPLANVKINEFITMTVKALGYRFESMSSDWAKPYIDKAIELGLILDREFTSYTANINREQMASIIVNAVALSEPRPSSTMDLYVRNETKDYYLVSDYYKQNIIDSFKYGIITGYADHTFKPKNFSNRAEASTVISKLLNKSQRKPFVKTDAKYAVVPTWYTDDAGNDLLVQTTLYAPLYNGKPVNEVVEFAELLGKVHDLGKGYIDYGYYPLAQLIGSSSYESKADKEYIYSLSPYEVMQQITSYSDMTISVDMNKIGMKFGPYAIQMSKRNSILEKYPQFSTYVIEHYGDQLKPMFQFFFGAEYDKAWNLYVKGLNHKGAVVSEEVIINGRTLAIVFSAEQCSIYFSIKP